LPGFDERLKQHLDQLAPPADPSGAFDRILEKKIRRHLIRRFEAAGLAVVVVAATIGGTFALVQAFRSNGQTERLGGIHPTPVPVRNGRIAYNQVQGGNADIWTINPDGSQPDNITADSNAANYTSAWSPDGSKIAFIRERNSDPTIYIAEADGANAVPIKVLAVSNHDLAWAPDGSRIAYTNRGDIFAMNADGSGSRRVTESGPQKLDFHPTWSPDGSRIAFARFTFSEPLSHDVFSGQEPSGSGIYIVKTSGADPTRLTEGPSPDIGLDEWPDWSPDGKQIVFQRAFQIYVMNVDGSGLKKLTSGGSSAAPSWSPDGTKLVFQREIRSSGEDDLYIMDADGSGLTSLHVGPAEDLSPDWQPVPAVGSETPPATSEPSPSPTPSPLPAMCHASQAIGDFDGDGQPDTATVALTKCLLEPGDQRGRFETEYSLDVRWPPFEGIVPLPDCENVCQALAATDLNLDGIDEFVLKVNEGSSYIIEVFELPASEAFGDPASITPPGGPGFPPDQAAQFGVGGSVTAFAALGCPGNNQIIVEIAKLDSKQSEYAVHETVLRFDPIDAPPFGQFTVVSTRDYTESYDQEVGPGDRFEPGGPCWMEEPNP